MRKIALVKQKEIDRIQRDKELKQLNEWMTMWKLQEKVKTDDAEFDKLMKIENAKRIKIEQEIS